MTSSVRRRSTNTVAHEDAFAIWVTGLPASGKSTLVKELCSQLAQRSIHPAVLESDVLRPVFTPDASYQKEDRDLFYRQLAFVGSLLVHHGVPVIFDATANLRRYRDAARREIPRFIEVFLNTPLDVCVARDPKGIYRQAREGRAEQVPGLQTAYEPPLHPEITADFNDIPKTAERIVAELTAKRYLSRK